MDEIGEKITLKRNLASKSRKFIQLTKKLRIASFKLWGDKNGQLEI